MAKRVLIIVLAALVVWLITLGAYHWIAYRPPRDLYDGYAKLALTHIHPKAANPIYMLVGEKLGWEEQSDYDIVRRWSRRFGNDPRYWQLLDTISLSDMDEENHQAADLVKAIDRGVYDRASFTLMSRDYIETHGGEARLLALFDKAIALEPENGWFYYMKADYLLDLGEIEQAQACLKLGNNTPRVTEPIPFPVSEALKRSKSTKAQSDRAAIGFILITSGGSTVNYIHMKEEYKNAEVCFALGYPLDLADDLFIRAKRMGQITEGRLQSRLVSSVFARMLLEYIDTECLTLTARQQQEADDLTAKMVEVKSLGQQLDAEIQAMGIPSQTTWYWSWQGSPTFHQLTKADWAKECDALLLEDKCVARMKGLFDFLDPPPFAAWAEGRSRFDKSGQGHAKTADGR